jgi:hypothetical protein
VEALVVRGPHDFRVDEIDETSAGPRHVTSSGSDRHDKRQDGSGGAASARPRLRRRVDAAAAVVMQSDSSSAPALLQWVTALSESALTAAEAHRVTGPDLERADAPMRRFAFVVLDVMQHARGQPLHLWRRT